MAKRKNKQRVKNNVTRQSGIGTEFDFGTEVLPSGGVPFSPFMQDKLSVDLFYTDWQAKKIINIPVEDMLRDEWEYDGLDEVQANKLLTVQDSLNVLETVKQAMRLERLVGGAVIYMGISDGAEDASKPINLAGLSQGCLKFLNVIPRTAISNTQIDMNPLSANYGRPDLFYIKGEIVHRSRLIMFKGDPLTPMPDSTITPTNFSRNDGFGQGVLIPIYDDITRSTGTRQAAYQLVNRASVIIAQMDTLDLSSTEQGQASIAQMQNIVNQINMFRGAVINRDPGQTNDTITTLNPSFGSVPELLMSFIQVLSAASDIPATRFLGQAPGGLNATGESDLENYYGSLESKRRQNLRPQLMQLLGVMGRSAFGSEFSATNVDILFKPLWSLSELELSTIRTADVTNVTALVDRGLIGDAEAIEELKAREALKIEVDAELLDDLGDPDAVP